MKMLAMLGLAFSILCSGSAYAELTGLTGNDLHAGLKMEATDPAAYMMCVGYTTGVAHALSVMFKDCFPAKATGQQSVDIVKVYLEENPHVRHLSAMHLSALAMTRAFCPEKAEELVNLLNIDTSVIGE